MISDRNVAYLGCIDPRHIPADLDDIVDAGCTSVTLTVDECDWSYYRTSRRVMFREARARGLKTYLGLHGFGIFSTPIPSHQYPLEHPEACQVYNTGQHAGAACPNDAGFVTWLKSTVVELVEELQPDGIFWDEPAFHWSSDWPQVWACRCANCQRLFKQSTSEDMPEQMSPQVQAFQQDSMLRFLTEIIRTGKEAGGGESVLCLMPWDRTAGRTSFSGDWLAAQSAGWYGVVDWEPFIEIPWLDVFSTDPYWIHGQSYEYFETNVEEAVRLAHEHGKKCQIWVQAVWISPGKEAEVKRTLLDSERLGVDMLAVWSYRGEPGGHLLDGGGDPDLTWQMVKEAYHKLGPP